jgi:hypothetical protein
VADKQAPPFTRSEQTDTFIFSCTPLTSQGIANYGTAGCARAGIDNGYRPPPYVCTPTTSQGKANIGVSDCARADVNSDLFAPTVLHLPEPSLVYP